MYENDTFIVFIVGIVTLHIREAKHLIAQIDRRIRDTAKALDRKGLMNLFVPAFRGEGVVLRHSLKGRVLLLLRGKPQRFALEQRVDAAGRIIRQEILSVGTLAQHDSTVWKEWLKETAGQRSEVVSVVYDITNRVIVGGDHQDVDQKVLSANDDFVGLVI